MELHRSTRHGWRYTLPLSGAAFCLFLFGAVYGLITNRIEPSAWVLVFTSLAIFLWILGNALSPRSFVIKLDRDWVSFFDSRQPEATATVFRKDIICFFVKELEFMSDYFEDDDSLQPICFETTAGDVGVIDTRFVYHRISAEFFDYIRREWGPEYVRDQKAGV